MHRTRPFLMLSSPAIEPDAGIDNAGGGSSEEATDFDYSQFGLDVGQDESPSEPQAPVATEEVTTNPAWQPYLKDIPEALHAMVTPAFKEWDRNVAAKLEEAATYRKTIEQYEPYKEFVEAGLDPQFIGASLAIANDLRSDPVAFLEDLKGRLVAAGRYEEAAQVQQAQTEIDSDSPPDPYEQQLSALQAQQQQMLEQFQQQQEQQEYENYYQEAQAEAERSFAAIEQRIGQKLSDPYRARVIQESLAMEQQLNRAVTIEEGFTSLQGFLAQAQQARRAAPRVIPTGGNVQQPMAKDPSEMTLKEKQEWFTQRMGTLGE